MENDTTEIENEQDGDDQAILEALKQVFDTLDSLEEKVDQLIEKDKGVHQMIEKED